MALERFGVAEASRRSPCCHCMRPESVTRWKLNLNPELGCTTCSGGVTTCATHIPQLGARRNIQHAYYLECIDPYIFRFKEHGVADLGEVSPPCSPLLPVLEAGRANTHLLLMKGAVFQLTEPQGFKNEFYVCQRT